MARSILLLKALEAAREAAAIIHRHYQAQLDVRIKADGSPVTLADEQAEEAIKAVLIKAFPTHDFLGEESGRSGADAEYLWLIDPIDGTKSFILGQLHWAILIALHDGTAPVVGVAYQPFVGEMFSGVAGGTAQWQRGDEARTLNTRKCARIEDAVVATTDPRQFVSADEKRALAEVSTDARLLRYGGDCYCYTQLAMGLVDVVIENGLGAYDIQALIPLIEAAGGVVSNWSGGRCDQGGAVLACGDPTLHKALISRLKG